MTKRQEWATYDPLTLTYVTRDGTRVASELIENCETLGDVLYIAHLRAKQRESMTAKPSGGIVTAQRKD